MGCSYKTLAHQAAIGLRLLSSAAALRRAAVAGSSAQASAHWFNSSAQTCCGQPVRPCPLLAWAQGRVRKAFMLLLPEDTHKKGERDRFKYFCSITQV